MVTSAVTSASERHFDSYYAREIGPALADLETHRQKRMWLVVGLAILGAIGFGVVALLAQTNRSDGPIALAAFGVGLGGLVSAGLVYLGLTNRYKQVLTGGVCAYLAFEYALRKFDFPLDRFKPLLRFYQSAKLEDRIVGHISGVDFALCEGKFSRRKAKWRALILVCSFNKPFEGPYNLSPAAVAPIFAVYLVGTIASATIGPVAGHVGRRKVLWPMMLVIIAGLLVTLAPSLWAVIVGLAITTFGFFGAHSTASAWVARRSGPARAQGSALYLLAYYAGSSLLGTAAGLGWSYWQWPGVVASCLVFALTGLAVSFRLAVIPPLAALGGSAPPSSSAPER